MNYEEHYRFQAYSKHGEHTFEYELNAFELFASRYYQDFSPYVQHRLKYLDGHDEHLWLHRANDLFLVNVINKRICVNNIKFGACRLYL